MKRHLLTLAAVVASAALVVVVVAVAVSSASGTPGGGALGTPAAAFARYCRRKVLVAIQDALPVYRGGP